MEAALMEHYDPPATPSLTPPQTQILESGLLTSGFNCILQLPTGSGKTWLAEQAIEDTLRSGKRAVYLTPLRALANELGTRWAERFADHPLGVYTGDTASGSKRPPVPYEQARLLVMTPERLDACTRRWRSHWNWIPEVDLLVVDELHLLGDPHRGPRLEGALLRFKRLNPMARVLGLSATLGNRTELASWLDGIEFADDWRPIPLSWRLAKFAKATEKPEMLAAEVADCRSARGKTLVFVHSRRRAEALAGELKGSGIRAAHHHAGLQSKERRATEDALRGDELDAVISTGTLEMGLNLPVRRVVLYDLHRFDGCDFVPLAVNSVWQRGGRAGRRGLDSEGEVVLFAARWDRTADRYPRGAFEPVLSGLEDSRALAEQVLAEVSSGLCRRRSQLGRAFSESLAHHQGRLPDLSRIVQQMIEAEMLDEKEEEEGRGLRLRATRLGRIAVRQYLRPDTVVSLAGLAKGSAAEDLTFLDLLIACIATDDCEPVLPADFEELEDLALRLGSDRSLLLSRELDTLRTTHNLSGRRLLAVLKTALAARAWTRTGDAESVAEDFNCYPFEILRLTESLERILTALASILTPKPCAEAEEADVDAPPPVPEEATLAERAKALVSMVSHGLDEETVTLTFVPGIGGTLARRLARHEITDVEAIGNADPEDLASVRGISVRRAPQLIEAALEIMERRSAYRFREAGPRVATSSADWPPKLDPYRLRRALDLDVARTGDTTYRVTGGLDPHRVHTPKRGQFRCDCADHAKGHECKHLLAVRLRRGDRQLSGLAQRLVSEPTECSAGLDLSTLWMDTSTPVRA